MKFGWMDRSSHLDRLPYPACSRKTRVVNVAMSAALSPSLDASGCLIRNIFTIISIILLFGEAVVKSRIESLIYLIRGERVMLDQDLAELYQVETKALVQAVQRNLKRFPLDFMFQLSLQEFTALRSQIVTSKGRGGRRTAPYAFTEHGVAMLSSVLRSERATDINIEIIRAFVKLRQLIASNATLVHRLNHLEQRYDSQFKVVFDAIRRLMNETTNVPPKRRIGF